MNVLVLTMRSRWLAMVFTVCGRHCHLLDADVVE